MDAKKHDRPSGKTRTSPETGDSEGVNDIVKIILAIILPPLGVFFEVGLSKHFWINLILTLFGYIPGIIHALWIILRK